MNYEEIYGLESKYTSGGVGRRPVALVKAQGARLWDSEGNVYIDCAGAQGWANVGHSHPVVTQAIKAQLDTYVAGQESSYNDQRALWMRDLAEVMQTSLGWDSCYIHPSNSGTEAIEAALKFARYQTGRPNIVATMRGFHGRTMGSLSATWNKKYREPFEPLVPGFNHVPYDNIEAMTEATCGLEVCQLIARSRMVWSWSAHHWIRRSTAASLSSSMKLSARSPQTCRREPSGRGCPSRYLPVNRPDSSGKYGTNAMPSRSQASNTPSVSGARFKTL